MDGERLRRCRALLGVPDSELVDRALASLLDDLLGRAEIEALTAMPYEADPDVSWQAPPGPDLPYAGDIPPEVRALAERRRAAS